MKYSTRSGTSSMCDRSGGRAIGSTFKRKNRSARKACLSTSFSRSRLVAAMTRTSTWMSVEPPTRLKLFSSRNRSSFACSAGRHLADFVEEDRPAVGGFQQAFLLHARVGERAALVTEQLALQQLLRQGRARDVHERPRRPIAGVVDDLGEQVLAGAALAGEQHGRRRCHGDAGGEVAQGNDRRRDAPTIR